MKAEDVLIAGGGRKDNYLSEMISHVIAEDGSEDEVIEAKELFRLPVVMVSSNMYIARLLAVGNICLSIYCQLSAFTYWTVNYSVISVNIVCHLIVLT